MSRTMMPGAPETPEESYSTPRAYKPAGMPPPQKKLHREAKRKVEDKPDERLKSARRALSAIFTAMPGPQTPEQPKRSVHSTTSTSEVSNAACHEKVVSCRSTDKTQEPPSPPALTTIVQSCMSAAGMRTRKAVSDLCMGPRKSQSCPCKPYPLQGRGLARVARNA